MAILTNLANFNRTDGSDPVAGLTADAAGNLFGTTTGGGTFDYGTVFEIAQTAAGYASTPATLVSFNGVNGSDPRGLVIDAAGNIFGTTAGGGTTGRAADYGTVFEIANTGTGYANSPTTLAVFDASTGLLPGLSDLTIDAAGNLLGTTSNGGTSNIGTVFEIARTSTGYASAPTTLVSFNGANGANPVGGLVADAAGNLFGVTAGTVFQIARTSTGYADTAITLASFEGTDLGGPHAGLAIDSAGDLFGTTFSGGVNGRGTVFELAKTDTGYANIPLVLVSFDGQNGGGPSGELVVDSAGDLFGTTSIGGAPAHTGTVFEVAKTATGYASTPAILAGFDRTNGNDPSGRLIVDSEGNLFGTTSLGGDGNGTVFEVAAAGFQIGTYLVKATGNILLQKDNGSVAIWGVDGMTIVDSALVSAAPASWHVKGTGSFSGNGTSDVVLQNDDGSVAIWTLSGATITASALISPAPASWHVKGTGDFNGDGKSDMVLQNDDGSVAVWTMNGMTITGSALISPAPASWHVVGTGDFNGDGKSDIVLQNDNGSVGIWTMDGMAITGSALISPAPASWHVVGTGDFNGDGKSDIVLQNDDGSVAIWTMNGMTITGSALISPAPASWHVVETGDYNGDGKSDIVLQNDDGSVAIWDMNGMAIIGSALVSAAPASWHVTGSDAMRFISGASTGTLNATGASEEFVFTSVDMGPHSINGFDPTQDVIALSKASFPDFASVQAHSTAAAGGTLVTLNDTSTLMIQGVLPGSLHDTNFVFV